jgi:hypothetical protein
MGKLKSGFAKLARATKWRWLPQLPFSQQKKEGEEVFKEERRMTS